MLKSTNYQDELDRLEEEYRETLDSNIIPHISDLCKIILEEWGDVEI